MTVTMCTLILRVLKLFFTLICTLLNIPVFLGAVPIVLLCLPYRMLVLLCKHLFRPELDDMVRGSTNSLFAMNTSPVPTANGCVVLFFDRSVPIEELRDRFRRSILNEKNPAGSLVYGKLQQIIVGFMGYRFYRQVDSFDLNAHIRPYDLRGDAALPVRPGGTVTEADLSKICGRMTSYPWIPGQSNWELLVLENMFSVSQEPRTALILRLNHALADGYCIHHILWKLSDSTSDPPTELELTGKDRQKSVILKLFWQGILPLRMIWDLGKESQHMNIMGVSPGKWNFQFRPDKPRRLMSVVAGPIPVEKIKLIKNRVGVSYMAVLLTAVSASLYKMSVVAGQRIPEKLVTNFPLPKPNHPGGMTNHMLGANLIFPIFTAATCSALRKMDAELKRAVSSTSPLSADIWLSLAELLPVPVAKIFHLVLAPSILMSAFRVESNPAYFFGSKLEGNFNVLAGLAFPTRNGASIAMGGADGKQRITVTLDKDIYPFPEAFDNLGHFIEEEIDLMYKNIDDCVVNV